MNYIGIDPGKSGGIAVLNDEGNLTLFPIPKIGTLVDLKAIDLFIGMHTVGEHICLLEDVHSLPGMSAKSNFVFGENKGQWQGMLTSNHVSYQEVTPKAWQKVAWQGVPVMKKPNKKTDTKAMSLTAAKRLFPNESFLATERSSVPHDGLVDAALMAYYLKRTH